MPYARSLLLSLATLAAGTMLFPLTSQAGFEFKPSPALVSPAPAAPAMQDVPSPVSFPPHDDVTVIDQGMPPAMSAESISSAPPLPGI